MITRCDCCKRERPVITYSSVWCGCPDGKWVEITKASFKTETRKASIKKWVRLVVASPIMLGALVLATMPFWFLFQGATWRNIFPMEVSQVIAVCIFVALITAGLTSAQKK